jgi:two-component system, cell cycle sensor histidine kinase and response regulator CckA
VLRSHGYRVLEASDGREAIDMWSAKGEEVDLLVTDIVMPNGLKGNVLAERLKADKADLKVIFSSGYSCDFATEAAPLDERYSFLEKPYKPEVLVKAVRDCLDS